MSEYDFDLIVIGSGPGGQQAALQGAKAGKRVAMIERERRLGGTCVHHGTIPSKTLRTAAQELSRLSNHLREGGLDLDDHTKLEYLRQRRDQVADAHIGSVSDELEKVGVTLLHGHGRFVDPHRAEVLRVDGSREVVSTDYFVVSTGSSPRKPDNIVIDHEYVLDSDSLLALDYLPNSLTILGSGIIASEYASIFALMGVTVTMLDRYPHPIGFLDPELSQVFEQTLESLGSRFIGGHKVGSVEVEGLTGVRTQLDSGACIESDLVLVAQGRIPNTHKLGLEIVGIETDARGHIPVDAEYRSAQSSIFAIGDVIGPPALASYSMEQGRRAVCHAFELEAGRAAELIPMGIYTYPELAQVGLDAVQAEKKHGAIRVGRARFSKLARGQISGSKMGMLKLICDEAGEKVLGVSVAGDGAAELVHIGQMAMLHDATVEDLIQTNFNFPTLAEAYRVAALDVLKQRGAANNSPARAA